MAPGALKYIWSTLTASGAYMSIIILYCNVAFRDLYHWSTVENFLQKGLKFVECLYFKKHQPLVHSDSCNSS